MEDDDVIGPGDDFLGGDLTDTVPTQETPAAATPPETPATQEQQPAASAQPAAPTEVATPETPAQPAQSDREANAFAVIQAKLTDQQRLNEQLMQLLVQQQPGQPQAQAQAPDLELDLPASMLPEEIEAVKALLTSRDQHLDERLSAVRADVSLQFAASSIEAQKAQSGKGWSDYQQAAVAELTEQAQLLGLDPNELIRKVNGSPSAGQQIVALATRHFQRQAPAATPPVDVEAIKRQAIEEHLAKQGANPYNLAPPSISGITAQVVATTTKIEPGSREEEELLGRP